MESLAVICKINQLTSFLGASPQPPRVRFAEFGVNDLDKFVG